jgi:hypothetical protein
MVGYTVGFVSQIKNQEPCVARKLAVVANFAIASTFRQLRERCRSSVNRYRYLALAKRMLDETDLHCNQLAKRK